MKFWTLLATSCVLFIVVAQGVTEERVDLQSKRLTDQAAATPRKREIRQREGAKFTEQSGRFQLAGDRVVFVPAEMSEEHSFRVLENLTLERVLENLNESQSDRLWTVSGVVTEFRSSNFLLLTKAVVETKEAREEIAN